MDYNTDIDRLKEDSTLIVSDSFVSSIFAWMFGALLVTSLTAYLFGTSHALTAMMYKTDAYGEASGITIFGWTVMLSPLVLVFFLSATIEKLKLPVLILVFFAYSALLGMSISYIFLIFSNTSIVKTFLITAGMFGVMAILGYTTKKDLSRFRSILVMALIGLLIATAVNLFMRSPSLDFIISIAGVIIFTGVTAYDMQTIKKTSLAGFESHEQMVKISIQAALNLYMDILNLFLYLLRFYGKGRR